METAGPVDTCVILAAGAGSRIAALKAERPKSLLPVANKPLIAHQLELLSGLGVTRVILAAHAPELEEPVRALLPPGLGLEFIHQGDAQGIAHSLARLESLLGGIFMLLLGDIFLKEPALRAAAEVFPDSTAQAVIFARDNSPEEEVRRSFAVVAGANGRVGKVVEKPDRRVSDTRGCGVYLFKQPIFDAIRRTPRSPLRNEYELTDAIQTLIESGAEVRAASPGKWDININTPEDLLLCNLLLADIEGCSIVSETAVLHPGARVSRSVIGAGARVANPILISNSLVAGGVTVDDSEPVENTIIFPAGRYSCRPDMI